MGAKERGFGPPLAIVAAEVIFPGARTLAEFWRMVVGGEDQVVDVPGHYWRLEDFHDPEHGWGKTYARRGAFVPKVDFDPIEFGIPPRTLPSIDSVQLLTLLVARDLLARCESYQAGRVTPPEVGVVLGSACITETMIQKANHVNHPAWRDAMRAAGVDEQTIAEVLRQIPRFSSEFTEDSFPGGLTNIIAGRVTNRFGLGGTNYTVDAACASSLAAVTMACRELQAGTVDMVITGGSEASSDPLAFQCFTRTPALSRTWDARPFSDQADGTLLGEGVGLIALRRLEDAERDGDSILALVRGVGSSSDGRAKSIYAPLPGGQQLAYRRAYDLAGVSPTEIELVEAHGTATPANDASEFEGLTAVYRDADGDRRQWCALGSIKSQIGHTRSAAGAASLVKAALAVGQGVYPPTIKVERPNPAFDIERSPFYLNTTARPWVHEPGSSRKAAVTSLGFGGTNFHVVLEEYRGPAPRPARLRASSARLLLFSAADREALAGAVAGAEETLRAGEATRLSDRVDALERKLLGGFDGAAGLRLAALATTPEEVPAVLAEARERLARASDDFTVPGRLVLRAGEPGEVAFLFPGQGSQAVDMGRELAVEFEAFRRAWDHATTSTPDHDAPLHRLVFPPPAFEAAARDEQEAALVDTRVAQPALAATELGFLALLEQLELRPAYLGGHSFGELVALHAAGSLPEASDLLGLARARGEAMAAAADAAGGSGMTAVRAGPADVEGLLEDGAVVLANHNGPDQVVLAGGLEDLGAVERRLDEAGLAYRRLPVAAAFHSPHVAGAATALRDHLAGLDVRAPGLPVFANASAAPYPGAPEGVRDLLAEQLTRPVRFAEQVEAMYAAGARTFVEVGPGRVLTGLVRLGLRGRPHAAVPLGGRGVLGFLEAVGTLACLGVPMRLERLLEEFEAPRAPPERVPSAATLKIDGANVKRAGLGVSGPPVRDSSLAGPLPVVRAPEVIGAGTSQPSAIQQIHANMAAAQVAYQEALARSHQEFMQASREILGALDGTGRAMASRPALPAADPEPPTGVAARAPVPPAAFDHAEVLLEALAELTGYPKEAISLDQDLEADLGVDSIKRVELLAAYRNKVPDLVVPESVQLLRERTLRGVIERLTAGAEAVARPGGPESMPTKAGDAEASLAAEGVPGAERFVVEAVPAPESCEALPGLGDAPLYLVGDELGVAPLLADHLRAIGVETHVAAEAPQDAAALVCLAGLSRDAGDREASAARNAAGFAVARRCGASVRDHGGLLVVVQDTGGDLNFSGGAGTRSWGGGLPALAKTAALEWPGVTTKAIDVDCRGRTPDEIALDLFAELTEGGSEAEVGRRAGGLRVRPELRLHAASEPGRPLPDGTVVVASGGARGITARCLLALAERSRLRLALLGSTPLEGDAEDPRRAEILGTLAALEERGAEVRYLALDVRDRDAVAAALDGVRREWGGIEVLVHGAGVIADAPLLEKQDDEFSFVFRTKVDGFRNLLDATREDALTHLYGFSSVVARDGNPGQVDYTMANEVLNKVCQSEARVRGDRCQVRSLAWGPWDGGMVQAHHKTLFELAGRALLAPEVGAACFVREVEDPDLHGGVEILLRATA